MPTEPQKVLKQPIAASRLRHAFPKSLAPTVDLALNIIPLAEILPTTADIGSITIDQEDVHIPSRIYSPEPTSAEINALTSSGQLVVACLYSRHHDGLIRQKQLDQILPAEKTWIPPFVIQLVGEYVIEIVQSILAKNKSLSQPLYSQFIADNPKFIELTKQRIISYWSCYYRNTYKSLEDYPAFQLGEILGIWSKKEKRPLT